MRTPTSSDRATRTHARPCSPLRALAVAAMVLGGTACGGSPADTLKDAISWTATARLLVDQRLAGSTSTTFTAGSLRRVADEATSLARALDDAGLPAADRAHAAAATRAVAVLVARAADAARKDDVLARARTGLDSLQDTLAAIAQRAARREGAR